jgi:hypothetical protein
VHVVRLQGIESGRLQPSPVAGIREQAEVFVFGQEDARLRMGQCKDDFVLHARIDFYDDGHVVAGGGTESGDDYEIALSSARNRTGYSRRSLKSLPMKTTSSWAMVSAAYRMAAWISSRARLG